MSGFDRTEWTTRDDEDHAVYIMCHLDENWELQAPSKIGISKNPQRRLKQVQTTEPGRVILVETFWFWKRSHALMVELEFHRKCGNFRLDGEWFSMAPSHAVAVMDRNLKAFVADVLQPADVSEHYSAYDHIGLPGFSYLNEMDEFKYTKGRQ